ncbi:E3 UFM1-protein ligase 1 homolog [Sitodiplosis mosellana]|uniref:E3 UFM1-protein ligase 1 homolog n=1 Tax=Sitodiplosis mosellana TaxID=263140 RepID=UPI0024449CEE|nr:E3 UFM1-protein ligase 1 homolog [Sitodiplosis mosellana]
MSNTFFDIDCSETDGICHDKLIPNRLECIKLLLKRRKKMSSDWDEIRRLASDFQKVQLSSTLQRLSERNCVEVVSLLIKQGLINVVYTTDGKEYITPEHLQKEVEDELYVHGGRVNLVELAQILNVDLFHINTIAERISKERDDLYLILGQLIDETYLQRIAIEINEKLAQEGEISVSDLTIQFDLPSEFLLAQVMEKYLGKLIKGRQDSTDSRIFFTPTYISRCKAKIRGGLLALTHPTSTAQIIQQIGVQERIFFTLFNEVNPAGVLTSKQHGAQYIPHVYTKNQREWVESFYKQNFYLEYDAVNRLGVSDAKGFIKRTVGNEPITFLSKCCLGQRILDQIESSLDECISTGSYLDVGSILPSIMSEEDIEGVIDAVLTPIKQKQTLLFGTTILTTQFIDGLLKPCHELIEKNAKQSVETGKYQQYIAEKQMSSGRNADIDTSDRKSDRKDERRRKATGGKSGGGAQGRETKTKSTKKLYRASDRGHQSDSEEETFNSKKKEGPTIELISLKEIKHILDEQLEPEGLDDLSELIAKQYYPSLTKLSLEIAHQLYEISLQNTTQNQRQTHAALQTKLNELLVNVRLYEKGLHLLSADLQGQLVKYLLKTHGTDVCNDIFFYVAGECNLNFVDVNLKPEQRAKIAQDCGQEYKAALTALNKAIAGTSIEEFLEAAENALEACGMILKKIDKKKDRNLILCHKHALLEQLSKCNDPALSLHLAVLVIFTISTQCMLHASGKFVSSILSFLQPSLSPEQSSALTEFHDLVLKLLSESDDTKLISEELQKKMEKIKNIASTYKKNGTTAAD